MEDNGAKLHKAIVHINSSENMSDETVKAINKMVRKALKIVGKKPLPAPPEK